MVQAESVLLEAAGTGADHLAVQRAVEEDVEPGTVVLHQHVEAARHAVVVDAALEPRVQLVHPLGVRELLRRGLDVVERDLHGRPARPTCPPSRTRAPSVLLPESPTCAASRHSGPMRQPWATMTRLSILVPRPTTVAPSAARSTVALAPTSTSSSSTTVPIWGILRMPSGSGR